MLIRWLYPVCLSLALFLWGCAGRNPEVYRNATLMLNGNALEGAAYVRGNGPFSVKLEPLLRQLGGTIDVANQTGLLIVLNGHRVMLGGTNQDVPYDLKIVAPIHRLDNVLLIDRDELVRMLRFCYGSADAYRQDRVVYVSIK